MSRSHPKQGILERFKAFKKRPDRNYFQLRLRHDLASLLRRAMDDAEITQRQAADRTGKHEAQISQIVHSEMNVTLSMIAQVLVPLGITPTIVSKAEWDALKQIEAESKETA